jgi:hypothetical protein
MGRTRSARGAALTFALTQLASLAALGHDVSLEVGTATTVSSPDNPRSGSVSVAAAGAWDASDAWSVFGSAQYTRDLATSTGEFSATGSNVFFFTLGTSWAPSEHLLTMLNLAGSPPTRQVNTTAVTVNNRTADVAVEAETWSVGGLWSGAWMSAGDTSFESAVDVTLGVTRYDVFQKMQLGTSTRAQAVRAACASLNYQRTSLCRLLSGASTPLLQGRLGAGYTATLFDATDLSVSATYYLYDKDPDEVGFFSLVALGRAELGSGVPVLPLQLSVKPTIVQRLGAWTLRVAYQLGLYQSGDGLNHSFTGKLTWKTSRALRLFLSLTGQFDAAGGEVVNAGGNGVLGALVTW